MKKFLKSVQEYIDAPQTRFFIIDSIEKSTTTGFKHEDVDFKFYNWNKSIYNKIRENSLFIYRRGRSNPFTNGMYHFFGAGLIKKN